ncbi:arrestin domain-containing protein 1 isoform X2 [Oryx dammah]|uniref:arrestin domain-containing protein 1 isoform X2 n=1 Tax=Oryx dammah TaxID=59534 RepID=UPI001A9B289A|nr:arrestin domain-containing protein 1 isoform X2 [Oryx dammah]
MGRVQLFEVRLNHGRVVYSPGEPLVGAVRVRLAAPLPFRAIRVTCTGSCRVSSKANDSAWVVEESYFNSALSLADKGSLPAGEHSFPFQFLLPATAPTSFEGPFGKIVHQVRATIDTPRFSKDHQCSRVFYILSPLNLNSIPDIEQPNVASTTKKFSYKLVKTGSVVLTASTDLRGYVVGQVLRLQADIENQSGKDTSPVVASLLQKVSYKAKRWIYDVRTIAEVEGAGVKAWRRAQWQEQVLVPALPQSALPGCSLIHVDYYLQVVGVRGGEGGRAAAWLLTCTTSLGLPETARSCRDAPGLHRQHRCEPRPAEPPARPRPGGTLSAAPGGGGGCGQRPSPLLGSCLSLHQEPLPAAAAACGPWLCAPWCPRTPSSGWQPCSAPSATSLVHLHRCHCALLCRGFWRSGAHLQHPDPPPGVQLVGLPL